MLKRVNHSVGMILSVLLVCLGQLVAAGAAPGQENIPLPEHPRPDFQRPDWVNLNGTWKISFDPDNVGEKQNWQETAKRFSRDVLVPFPWGSPLSGVSDDGDIAWYTRKIRVPASWKGKRVFLVIGACDWHTTAWLDRTKVGTNQSGYTPFEFELTPHVKYGEEQTLVLRVDDTEHPFKLYGKQDYGKARGIWQTPYLEARGQTALKTVQFSPDIDKQKVSVRARFSEAAGEPMQLALRFKTGNLDEINKKVSKGAEDIAFDVPIPNAHLWSLEDPFLYDVDVELSGGKGPADRVSTYFGMRKISIEKLPGRDYTYIALNNKPVYLQMTLDQAYHPEGYYTFPSDDFMRGEILRSRRIGLNGMRIHVKIGIPRKIYWADRLGMLIMADIPNSWGQPNAEMRREVETALHAMIERDYNHPSIFSWVLFNETWGLRTKDKGYTAETKEWVASLYKETKALDPTRLVEDNSANRKDHVVTDINSWHAYLPGYRWKERLDQISRDTFPGSGWNYADDRKQGNEPQFNSECGNVWGYKGSTGDVDWSWDYHLMINEFRRHPKTCGWLYTEHHDVINEWNGYWRYDRSEKFTGMGELVEGMSLMDMHSLYYLSPGPELCEEVRPGANVKVPLWASVMTDCGGSEKSAIVQTQLYGWDTLGRRRWWGQSRTAVELKPWMSEEIAPLEIRMPNDPGLAVLSIYLEDATGKVLHRNFTTYLVGEPNGERAGGDVRTVRFAPKDFSDAKWTVKQWNVLDGLKVNGAGSGYFEYKAPWPKGIEPGAVEGATLVFEASAKQLFGKDREGAAKITGDYMRGRGTHDPSLNANSYPMTDTTRSPSAVRVRVEGETAGLFDLPDDPADHRGILSWHAQKRDNQLREAGSYGYLIEASIPPGALRKAATKGEISVRLEVDEALPGGLAVYGAKFGRYPLDPTVVFRLK